MRRGWKRGGLAAVVLTLAACAPAREQEWSLPRAVMEDAPAPAKAVVIPPAENAPPATAAAGTFIHARAIIIIRHADINVADKATLGAKAPLTERGKARAGTLVEALKSAGITKIYTSETLRTQETAAAIATELKLTPEAPFTHSSEKAPATGAAPGKKNEAGDVVAYLAAHAASDDIILLVHHHSVIPHILAALGYPDEPPMVEDKEFDRVYVVLPDAATGTYHVLRLRYAATPSP